MARGYGHRKLYPYVTKKQAKLAPGMVGFVKKNRDELTDQGNKVLSAPGQMTRNQAKKPLREPWRKTQNTGTSSRRVSKYLDAHGGSRGRATKILTQAHAVSFGADPRSK